MIRLDRMKPNSIDAKIPHMVGANLKVKLWT